MRRIAFVLKKFRRFLRTHPKLASPEARDAFLKMKLDKDEFVECGGHKNCSAKNGFDFYRLVVVGKRDMEDIMRKGRFNKSKSLPPSGYISSDAGEESEEDVDQMDNQTAVDPSVAECMDSEEVHDDNDDDDDESDLEIVD